MDLNNSLEKYYNMSRVQSGRRVRSRHYSKGFNFTKFGLTILAILLLIGIGFLSVILKDAESYVYGFFIGFGFVILMYILFKYVPDYYLKRG